MLSIRMQRLGRKGHPTYRVVVQDSRYAPTSGKYVALLGSYDPHTKQTTVSKEKAEYYLKHGAQPSDRVAKLFVSEKIKLPDWFKQSTKQERAIKNPDKLRKNRPAGETQAEEEKPIENESEEQKEHPVDVSKEDSTETEKPANKDEEANDKES